MTKYRLSVLVIIAVLMAGIQTVSVKAAFPYDMEEKPVWAYAITMDDINVYEDENLEHVKKSVSGNGFVLITTKESEDGLFGSFEDGDHTSWGWFDKKDFIDDPEYEHEYATVRDSMAIYTDESFDEQRDVIKKYSGVIAISQIGEDRQVIYEKKDHYGTGWMTESSYSDTLLYDGREKQSLRDGIYLCVNGYLDNEKGGETKQIYMEEYPQQRLKLTHLTGDYYEIQDAATEEYLCVDVSGKKPKVVRSAKEQQGCSFRIHRLSGAFTIQSAESRTFLTQNREGKWRLSLDPTSFENQWRIKAEAKIQEDNDPFVITQYDPEWCATPYGGGGCMGTAGCGILAPVNAVYALTGQYMDVMELADYAVKKHYRIVDNGTDEGIFKASCKAFGKKYGFAWDGGGDIKKLKKKLNAGDVAVVHVQGHYVAITAYDKKKNKYLLLDSNYLPKREDTPFGDWIKPSRLLEGTLEIQNCYFFKLDEDKKHETERSSEAETTADRP